MDKVNLTLNEAGSLLLGAGLVQLTNNVATGLIIVGVGAVLKIGVAILKKYGIAVGFKKKEKLIEN